MKTVAAGTAENFVGTAGTAAVETAAGTAAVGIAAGTAGNFAGIAVVNYYDCGIQ